MDGFGNDVIAEYLVRRDADLYSDDLLVNSAGQLLSSLRHGVCNSFSEGCSSSSKPCTSSRNPGICERASEPREDTRSEIVATNSSYAVVPFIFKGHHMVYNLPGGWQCLVAEVPVAYVRCAHLRLCRIASRAQKSLRGSSDDIGWLQRTHGMPGVEDGTARILELLAGIRYQTNIISSAALDGLIVKNYRQFEWRAQTSQLIYLSTNHPWPFILCWNEEILFKDGFSVPYCKNYSKASVAHNAWELKQYIEELYWGSDKRVMLLGHSKGGVDATAALSIYWCDLKDKVAALALVQSPFGGTPLASGSLREGQVADNETRQIMELLICKLIKGDIRALEDLTYEKRKEFHHDAQTPAEPIPLISFHSVASIAPGVLATMTHIAHAELPWLSLPNFGNKESDKSDGLVTCLDAEVPGSVVVRPERKLDHVWMVYSTKKKNPGEADASEM
ncbi:unnamed protein product [Malus baccata var. baccata]